TYSPSLIDDAQFRQLSSVPTENTSARLLYVGRLSPEKGHRFLFQAVDKLRRRGLACHVDIAGSGRLEETLKEEVARLGLADLVTFPGYVPYGPQLFALYRRAGAFVLPSSAEGFPQVINEALSVGLPIIATAVGGVPAFLTEGETALLVPFGDVDALAAAIE